MNKRDRQDLYYFRNRKKILEKRRSGYKKKMESPEYREKERTRLLIHKSKNREKIREKDAEYRRKNRGIIKYRQAEWEKNNQQKVVEIREKYKDQQKINADTHYEKNKDQAKKRAKRWKENNVHKVRFYNMMRKKRVKECTPVWLSVDQKKEILEKHRQAVIMEKEFNQKYHVDHRIPIKHDKVCGLHVPWNLQVIPARDNLLKSNSLD